ncbi:hypothetical protein D9M70_585310 [compost metagenome]
MAPDSAPAAASTTAMSTHVGAERRQQAVMPRTKAAMTIMEFRFGKDADHPAATALNFV